MKKAWAFILIFSLVISALPADLFTITASAETDYYGEYTTYTISNNTATLVAVDKSVSGYFSVPASVDWGKRVTAIAPGAFAGCNRLHQIYICNVTSVHANVFNGCTSLHELTASDNNPVYSDHDGVLFENETTLFRVPPGKSINSYTVPDGVTRIGQDAFAFCKMRTVIIPDSVTSIGAWAFDGCSKLTDITIPNSVTSIEAYAFRNCDELKDIWYQGTESDKQQMKIGSYNDCLTNATWHYNTCTDEHTYSTDCDVSCNRCEWIRSSSVSHAYDDGCDATCNNCDFVRTELYHVYDHDCDASCNVCDFVRDELEHIYDNDCDTVCSRCPFQRTVDDHQYTLNGSTTCSACKYSKAPEAPTISSFTTSSLTLTGQDYLEYSMDSFTWQDSPTFDGLVQNAQYTFYQRVKASEIALVSESSAGLAVDFRILEVHYDVNGGQDAPDDQFAFYATDIILSLDEPIRDGFAFAGWATKESCGKLYAPGEQFAADRNITFYALWAEHCAICNGAGAVTVSYDCTCDNGKVTSTTSRCSSCGGTNCITSVQTAAGSYNTCRKCGGINTGSFSSTTSKHNACAGTGMLSRDDVCSTCAGCGTKDDQVSAPVILSYTDTEVTLRFVDGYEYSLDGTTWQTSNVFTGLSPATQYTFYCRVGATEDSPFGLASNGSNVKTDKAKQTQIPNTPVVEDFTSNSITLVAVEGCEYSKDGTTWQTSNVFSGLSCGTEYTFYQRYKETSTSYAGKSSNALVAKTDKGTQSKPSAPTLSSKTHNSVTLFAEYATSGYEYSRDGVNWQTSNVFNGLEAETNYMFYQRKAETATYYASEASAALAVKTNEAPLYTPGDLTGDEKINSLDGLLLMRHLNGWDVNIASPEAMDVNADGKVNSLDGLILMRYLNGWNVTLG